MTKAKVSRLGVPHMPVGKRAPAPVASTSERPRILTVKMPDDLSLELTTYSHTMRRTKQELILEWIKQGLERDKR